MESFIPPDPCLCTVLLEHLRITTTFPYFPLWKAFHNGKERVIPLLKPIAQELKFTLNQNSPEPLAFIFQNRFG
jgi:hypothetical protein